MTGFKNGVLVSLGVIVCLMLSACQSNSGGGAGGRPPLAPAGLTATPGNMQITLTWGSSGDATSYNVTRATVSTGPFTQIAQPTVTTYVDTGLTNGTTYYYYVTAVNSLGESPNSKQVSAIPGPPVTIPAIPTGLQATAGDAQISLTWNASTGATQYELERATVSGGPYTQIGAPTAPNYTDVGLSNGTTYYYVVSAGNSAGMSANSSEVSATPSTTSTPPAAPTGVAATAGNMQVTLTWNASAGALSYQVKRATVNGGPYTQTGTPTTTSFTDTGLTNGTTYFYVIVASNTAGLSANSAQVSAIPSATNGTAIQVNVDALINRHVISAYVYGTNFPASTTDITTTGTTLVRWGGNASTRYNWVNFDTNAANDYYFENRPTGSPPLYSDSTQFVTNVTSAGGNPLMTIGMLPYAAKDQTSYSFSVAKYGAQCAVDPFNSDAGNGVESNCTTNVTGNNPSDADISFLDGPPNPGDPPGTVYRSQWLPALAGAFGGTQPHFYDMDNEMDIWGSTHRDVHPNPTGYNEMRDTFLSEAVVVKTYDPQATRFAPVSCCWYFYWNGANGGDKAAHAGIDLLPWWLNEVFWSDTLSLTRSLDVFDVHAYPDPPDNLSSMTHAQQQAAALRVFRDYWDPAYVSESSTINQPYVTQIQPLKTIPFRIPRLRGMLNMIYPGTPLSITEWNAALAGESDFSTALADADAYGILGRERVSYAARWTAPVSANPNYLALKLYRNYDGVHDTFANTSVSATHNADPDLFSVYAAVSQTGTTMTLMVINKDPANEARVTFALNNFTPATFATYTLSGASPTAIVTAGSQAWNASQTFPPYSATLVVVPGALSLVPAAEWDLNPDTIQAAANSTVNLAPTILSGVSGASVTLQTAQFDPGYTAGGTITIKTAQITQSGAGNGLISIATGGTPGFYHFTVTGLDSTGVTQKQGGWLIVGNPAATMTKTGDNQTGGAGTKLTLSATLVPGSSGGANPASGASILFSTTAGNFSGAPKIIAVTNGSGVATVTLTLPASSGTVKVVAEGPYGLGHPVVSFSETAQ
jgi:fibronectin type 3 domain-containing protein